LASGVVEYKAFSNSIKHLLSEVAAAAAAAREVENDCKSFSQQSIEFVACV